MMRAQKNFTSYLQQLSFHLQQRLIFAATFQAITASFFIMQQVLFVSKKYLNLQQLSKIEATFKIAAEVIKNCSNF